MARPDGDEAGGDGGGVELEEMAEGGDLVNDGGEGHR